MSLLQRRVDQQLISVCDEIKRNELHSGSFTLLQRCPRTTQPRLHGADRKGVPLFKGDDFTIEHE